MTNEVASLSLDGWLSSTPSKADQLFADFIVANNSQYPFVKIDASMPYLLARYPDDPRQLEINTRSALLEYFESYFQGSEVLVAVRVVDVVGKPLNWDMRIGIQIKSNGEVFEVCNAIAVGEQKVLSVVKIANGSLPFTA